ncbi:MAG: VCBS repeat-containing protein [bacterium]|nr:VCBS repeat-containing protein [bacterium]
MKPSLPALSLRVALLVLGAALLVAVVCLAASAQTASTPVPRRDDPGQDGWRTEAFQSAAGAQLRRIKDYLGHPSDASRTGLGELVTADFAGAELRPTDLREVWNRGSIRVSRASAAQDLRYRGAAGLAAALDRLVGPLADHAEPRVKFKIVHVDLRAGEATTRQIFSLTGRTASGSIEQHATWEAEWALAPEGESPRLRRLKAVGDFEENRFDGDTGTLFSDRTAGVLGHNASWDDQLRRGTWSWLGEIEASLGPDLVGHTGLAIGDVDGDGLEDLYAPQAGGLPNRLFLHKPDGTASDRSAWAGVDWLDRSQSALLVDLDDDGDKDLVVGTFSALLLMEGDGKGRFSPRIAFRQVSYAYSLAAADYDLDGDLDLYASRYTPLPEDPGATVDVVPKPLPYHDAENGAPNFLLRNDGGWRFTDATRETGLDADNRRWSFAASWEDFDLDGDPDLYVANDFGRNCLYRNDREKGGPPRFVNVAARAGVEDVASGMSVSWGDADRDGRMDLYVGNMFSSAGNRITFQNEFQPGMSAEDKAMVQRLARGNSLFLNRAGSDAGGVTFSDASLDAGVTLGRWAWSSIFVDLDNDGWEDLFVANGYLTAPAEDDL